MVEATAMKKPSGSSMKVGKVDNSASMQRAINRVSKDRTVKKNEAAAKKPKKTSSSSSSKTSVASKASSSSSSPKASTVKKTKPTSKTSSSSSSSTVKKTKSNDATKKTALKTKTEKVSEAAAKKVANLCKPKEQETTPKTEPEHEIDVPRPTTASRPSTASKLHKSVIEKKKFHTLFQNHSSDQSESEEEEAEISVKLVNDKITSPESTTTACTEERDSSQLTRKMIGDILREDNNDTLSFEFAGYDVPVQYASSMTYQDASSALLSSPFHQWTKKLSRVVGNKRLEIRHVEIQSVDFVEDRVDMIKMSTACVLIDEELELEEEVLSGVCYLRDAYVGLLLELVCIEDESSWSVLVDKPRVPVGSVSALELPVGKIDYEDERLLGFEIDEIEQAFGLEINMNMLTNLSEAAYEYNHLNNELGMCPSPSVSGEHVKIMHLKKEISKDHLLMMRSKFSQQREEGALISLRVVPVQEMWKVSADMKIMCALFLLNKANLSHSTATFEEDDIQDDISVSVRGRSFFSSMMKKMKKKKRRGGGGGFITTARSSESLETIDEVY